MKLKDWHGSTGFQHLEPIDHLKYNLTVRKAWNCVGDYQKKRGLLGAEYCSILLNQHLVMGELGFRAREE